MLLRGAMFLLSIAYIYYKNNRKASITTNCDRRFFKLGGAFNTSLMSAL